MTDDTQRLDRWLWFARFFKSRSLATKYCTAGRLRVNGTPVGKPHHALRAGDVLTFPLGRAIRVVRVVDLGQRRGPAVEARALYEDLEPPASRKVETPAVAAGARERGMGRPTKAARRAIERLREGN